MNWKQTIAICWKTLSENSKTDMEKTFGDSYRPFVVLGAGLLVLLTAGGGLGFFGCLVTVFVFGKLFQVWDKLKEANRPKEQ
jgi:hypothetical protein